MMLIMGGRRNIGVFLDVRASYGFAMYSRTPARRDSTTAIATDAPMKYNDESKTMIDPFWMMGLTFTEDVIDITPLIAFVTTNCNNVTYAVCV